MNTIIDIITEEPKWHTNDDITKSYIEKVALTVLQCLELPKKLKSLEICVLLTSNSKMQQLNSNFLGLYKPTNVLSFPSEELDPTTLLISFKDTKNFYLGDLAFGYDIIKKESETNNIELIDHFSHLLIHGILHLFGFDHQNEEDYQYMSSYEDKILSLLQKP